MFKLSWGVFIRHINIEVLYPKSHMISSSENRKVCFDGEEDGILFTSFTSCQRGKRSWSQTKMLWISQDEILRELRCHMVSGSTNKMAIVFYQNFRNFAFILRKAWMETQWYTACHWERRKIFVSNGNIFIFSFIAIRLEVFGKWFGVAAVQLHSSLYSQVSHLHCREKHARAWVTLIESAAWPLWVCFLLTSRLSF